MSESVLGPKSPCCPGKKLIVRAWPTLVTGRQKFFCECGAHYTETNLPDPQRNPPQ